MSELKTEPRKSLVVQWRESGHSEDQVKHFMSEHMRYVAALGWKQLNDAISNLDDDTLYTHATEPYQDPIKSALNAEVLHRWRYGTKAK